MDDWKITYLENRELTVFDERGQPVKKTRVVFKCGPFGPFTLEWPTAEYTPMHLAQAVEAKRAELRALPS